MINNLSSRVAPQVNYNLSRQITNVICPDRFFACISRAMWKAAAIVPARMDAEIHMASNTTEEPKVPKVVAAYAHKRKQQSHVEGCRHRACTNGCRNPYGEQRGRGTKGSEGQTFRRRILL